MVGFVVYYLAKSPSFFPPSRAPSVQRPATPSTFSITAARRVRIGPGVQRWFFQLDRLTSCSQTFVGYLLTQVTATRTGLSFWATKVRLTILVFFSLEREMCCICTARQYYRLWLGVFFRRVQCERVHVFLHLCQDAFHCDSVGLPFLDEGCNRVSEGLGWDYFSANFAWIIAAVGMDWNGTVGSFTNYSSAQYIPKDLFQDNIRDWADFSTCDIIATLEHVVQVFRYKG